MTRRIEEFIASNDQDTKRINNTLVQLDTERQRRLTFTRITITMNIEIEALETRGLGNSLISGHPDPEHGSGRGEGGDHRGGWSEQALSNITATFVIDGRNIVSEALNGVQGKELSEMGIGEGARVASPADTQLVEPTETRFGWTEAGDNGNETDFTSQFLFADVSQPSELGLFSSDGELYGRVTFDQFTSNQEIRISSTINVEGATPGNSVVTNDGRAAIAESIRSTDSPIGIENIVFGSSDTLPDQTDSSLGTEEFSQIGERSTGSQNITIQSIIPESTPSTQPVNINEIGVETNTGLLVWRTTLDTVEKTDELAMTTLVSFDIR